MASGEVSTRSEVNKAKVRRQYAVMEFMDGEDEEGVEPAGNGQIDGYLK